LRIKRLDDEGDAGVRDPFLKRGDVLEPSRHVGNNDLP